MHLPISEITTTTKDEKRLLDRDRLAGTGGSINPYPSILVTEDRRLIAGYSQLKKYKRLGLQSVPVKMWTAGDIHLRRWAIENKIKKKGLTALDEAHAICWCKYLYEIQYPQTRRGGDRRSAWWRQCEKVPSYVEVFPQIMATPPVEIKPRIHMEITVFTPDGIEPDVKVNVRSSTGEV